MIVITAPTSQIGRQLVEIIVGSGEPVRMIAREPSRLPARIREQVDVVQGSHGNREVVLRAFAGADALFWLVPPDPAAESLEAAYLDFSAPACELLSAATFGMWLASRRLAAVLRLPVVPGSSRHRWRWTI
ncbi:NAD(P)H-binding protein [Ensifer aridi]|uniref:NAD(P)H-binding protein n=1 Tax=Ensifer aridi TaxID=1708715 RepID=UPI001FCD0AF4|nr:NAD(P)H-binding protein [Ensifer aridi]